MRRRSVCSLYSDAKQDAPRVKQASEGVHQHGQNRSEIMTPRRKETPGPDDYLLGNFGKS